MLCGGDVLYYSSNSASTDRRLLEKEIGLIKIEIEVELSQISFISFFQEEPAITVDGNCWLYFLLTHEMSYAAVRSTLSEKWIGIIRNLSQVCVPAYQWTPVVFA